MNPIDRRQFLGAGLALTGAGVGQIGTAAAAPTATSAATTPRRPGAAPALEVPNGAILPLTRTETAAGPVHVGHLVAEEFTHTFAPGLEARCWGYNGRTPGPVLALPEGDLVRLYVTNRLPEPTTIHWHGLVVPNGMDGVSGLNQAPIPPGETWVYSFRPRRPGTYMYHSHFDEMTQMALGLVGMLVVLPKGASGSGPEHVDRDFVLMSHEWKLVAGARRPDPLAMNDFNVLTFNGKSYPATEPLRVRTGERVRIRLGNLGPMDHHSIHLHGPPFEVTGTDGGAVPRSARFPETTVLLPVGATRDIVFTATEPGDWALHCHMTHHAMTQMGHESGNFIGANTRALDEKLAKLAPDAMTMGQTGMAGMAGMALPKNSISMGGGPGPFGRIDMGGMFTVVSVRDGAATDRFTPPTGTQPRRATAEELARDGVVVAK